MHDELSLDQVIDRNLFDRVYVFEGFRVLVCCYEVYEDFNPEANLNCFDKRAALRKSLEAKRDATEVTKGAYKNKLRITEGTARMPIWMRNMLRN